MTGHATCTWPSGFCITTAALRATRLPGRTMKLDVEEIDLARLAEAVGRCAEGPLEGAIVGRSIVRDIVANHLGCSMLEAEQLVDTLIARGFARLERDSEGRELWRVTRGT